MDYAHSTPQTATPDTEQRQRFPLSCYANRELSWLQFNTRVLEEAQDVQNPLCERLSFAAIYQSNLDEFFMVRVGRLYDNLSKNPIDSRSSLTARQQLDAVLERVRSESASKDAVYFDLMGQLHPYRAEVVPFERLNDKQRRYLELYFMSEVQPLLAPQIVASKQNFPFLNGKERYVVVTLKGNGGGERFGIVPCSSRVLRRLIPLPARSQRYVLAEDLILHFAPRIFDHYYVTGSVLVRLLRNADITVDETLSERNTEHDYRSLMEQMLRTRQRLNPIKLDYYGASNDKIIPALCRQLSLPRKYTFASSAPLDLSFLFALQDILRDQKSLFFPYRVPQHSPSVNSCRPMIEQLLERDILLSFPYESIQPFLRLLKEAAHDPSVCAIQMTLYRVARNSQVVEALCQAAENGKKVTAIVELRARFDEENNIGWSHVLEDAGCQVIYGMKNIKVHCKLCLITRQTSNGVQFITQIGTGNYNEKTARQYADLSLMTSNQDIGKDTSTIFNALCRGEFTESLSHLLVAPRHLRPQLIKLIDAEIAKAKQGQPSYIGIKCNAVTDKVLIDKLIEASQAGVPIDMVVRGICCIVAGVPNYTESIRIVSVVGRYLEHSRIYLFGTGDEQKVYLASADFMTRNTVRRVEVAVPVYDSALQERIRTLFRILHSDNVKGRIQQPDGTYLHRRPADGEPPLCAQEALGTLSPNP